MVEKLTKLKFSKLAQPGIEPGTSRCNAHNVNRWMTEVVNFINTLIILLEDSDVSICYAALVLSQNFPGRSYGLVLVYQNL